MPDLLVTLVNSAEIRFDNSPSSLQVLASLPKIIKELEKGRIVRISVQSKGDPSAANDLENTFKDGLKEVLDSSQTIKDSFFFEIHAGDTKRGVKS